MSPTKREHDAQLREFLDPPPMTIEQALASGDPVGEIANRLVEKPLEEMSPAEKVFWSVSYFVADTLNGGLDQTLTNSTGELTVVFEEFVKRYGTDELRSIVADLNALFPGGVVPMDRDERTEIVLAMGEEGSPLNALTERFYACQAAIDAGLIALAKKNQASFNLSPRKTQSP